MIIGLQFETFGGAGWSIVETGSGYSWATSSAHGEADTFEAAVSLVRANLNN